MRLINFNWVVFLCLTSYCLFAQTTATNQPAIRETSLEECERQALEQNFDIRIELTRPRIAQYTLDGSYALYEPSLDVTARRGYSRTEGFQSGGLINLPTEEYVDDLNTGIVGELPTGLRYDVGFSMTHGHRTGTSRDDHSTDAGISLSQPLLKDFWISQPRAQIKINKGNLKISEAALEFLMMSIVRDVQKAYYDLIAALDEVKVREKALELAQQLFDENRKRVQAGVLAPLDEKQAESEVAVARADLIAARRQVVFQENILKNLITDKYGEWYAVRLQPAEKLLAIAETYNRSESWFNALNKRPDFNQARYELENQGVLVQFRHNQLFPELNLIGGYGRRGFNTQNFRSSFNDITADENPNYFFGTVISVPLGFRAERNSYRSAKETLAQLELQLQKKHQEILVEVEQTISLAEANYQQIPARREARLYAEAALEAEQKKLENGKSTSFFVLQLQRDLTSARAAEIRALSEYNKALSDFFFSEGTILERSKISVEFH